ncbi:MAG: tRNA uridine-5-carboxymethylaminomethyl(34) synthesis GTPase MnmE [Acidobacteria bacterium]|nr:tRNA uridine-5-carboxymethylaminomethyl(34) synthesis GTPase MnmE [Acidobacteriota bacterium]
MRTLSNVTTDTIAAISTAQGRSGIGVVRLSGPDARSIATRMLRLRDDLAPNHARFASIIDEHGARIDAGVVTWFAAPHSYTGEDVVEIAAHGSPVVLEWIVRRAITLGARAARPGEFTERAFLNHRIDLTQAEAVRDLIDAQTLEQARVAAEQVGGSLAARIRPAKENIIALIAEMEAGIDFAEDDIDTLPSEAIVERLNAVRAPMEELLASFAYGRVLHAGVKMAIIGRPNAGKSSLFNRLVESDRAIVTAIAGTTRDVVSERVSLGGIPVELMDTAGLREATDEVERIGIARSQQAMAEADIVLLVLDAEAGINEEERHLIGAMRNRSLLIVQNKIDLLGSDHTDDATLNALSESLGHYTATHRVSAKTGEGIEDLRAAILNLLRGSAVQERSGVLTNVRQQQAVHRSVDGLHRAHQAATSNLPHEMLLLDIYEALRGMDELTGETTPDDVLGLIFSTFCIGK